MDAVFGCCESALTASEGERTKVVEEIVSSLFPEGHFLACVCERFEVLLVCRKREIRSGCVVSVHLH